MYGSKEQEELNLLGEKGWKLISVKKIKRCGTIIYYLRKKKIENKITTISPSYLDVNWLKTNCQMIHYFGLGFIQVKLTDRMRMHFYTKELPAIISKEEIHNHRYGFSSKILKGTLKQEAFSTCYGNDYIWEQESCQEGVICETPPIPCSIFCRETCVYKAGESYYIDHETFHRVESDYAITFITRGDYQKKFAEVIRPVGATKICPFSQKVDEIKLWEIVEKMLNNENHSS